MRYSNRPVLLSLVVGLGSSLGPLSTTASAQGQRYVDRIFPANKIVLREDRLYRQGTDEYGAYSLWLDLVLPPESDAAEDRAWILLLHGGSFESGDRKQMHQYAREFARRGYVAVSADYRLQQARDPNASPTAAARAAQEDALAALAWVRARALNLKIEADRTIVGGFSAGSVTSAWVAYKYDDPEIGLTLPPVRGVVLLDGTMLEPSDILHGDPPLASVRSATVWRDDPDNARFFSLLARLEELEIPYKDKQLEGTEHADLMDPGRVRDVAVFVAPFLFAKCIE